MNAAIQWPARKGIRNQALGRLPAGTMNKTEAAYAAHLELRRAAGEVAWFKFEGVTFKLAADTRFTPDFAVMLENGEMEFHETKGWFTDDAKVKIKVAASQFPFRFLIIRARKKSEGGGWDIEEVSA